jgi:hypothetical protein
MIGLATAIPLLSAGVVFLPRARLLMQERQLERAEQQHQTLVEYQGWATRKGPLGRDEYDLLLERLRALLPEAVDQVSLMATCKQIGDALGFELQTVELGDPQDVGIAPLSHPLGEAPVVIHARGDASATAHFVEGLRAAGFPFELTGVSLRRSSPNASTFNVELRLGLYVALPTYEEFDPTLLPEE